MPSVTNLSSDALNMPSLGGLSLDPGETKEVSVEVAEELNGHPLLTVTFDAAAPATETAQPVATEIPTSDPPAPQE